MRVAILLAVATSFLLGAPVAAAAGATLVRTAADPAPWERVELFAASHARLQGGRGEAILEAALPTNLRVRAWFPRDLFVREGAGSAAADHGLGAYGRLRSDRWFLLGSAPGWSSARAPVPILLVHGASDDMNRAWAHPWDEQTPLASAREG